MNGTVTKGGGDPKFPKFADVICEGHLGDSNESGVSLEYDLMYDELDHEGLDDALQDLPALLPFYFCFQVSATSTKWFAKHN